MKEITVSVIIPNYNHERYLQKRLDSILNQTYRNLEIILLDDCSTDNSKEIIEKYRNSPKVSQILYNQQNGGTSYKQWYKGIEYAKGDLIWIAESDDWCDSAFLETLVPFFTDTEVTVAYCKSHFVSGEDDNLENHYSGSFEKLNGNDFIRENMMTGNKLVNASSVVFRKSKYSSVKGKGYADMKLCGDYLLWVQLMKNNKIVLIEDYLNYFRQHNTNTTNKYRALGFDFIEGVDVLSFMQKACKNRFDRRKAYLNWIDHYHLYKSEFVKGVKKKVLFSILIKHPDLFLFLVYKSTRTAVKRSIHQTHF